MVRPVQYDVVAGTVQGLQRILGEFGHAKCALQIRKGSLKLGTEIATSGYVVRVSEHLDVLVESLEVVFGVLCNVSQVKPSPCTLSSRQNLTSELTDR